LGKEEYREKDVDPVNERTMIKPPISSSPKEVTPSLLETTINVFKRNIEIEKKKEVLANEGDETSIDTKHPFTTPSQKH